MLKLSTAKNQQVFFTSDYHISHKNICRGTSDWNDKAGCRDFPNLVEMERTIVDNHNALVRPDDIVFNIGDIIFGDKTYLPDFLQRLSCRNIYYLAGNHCDWMMEKPFVRSLFKGFYENGQLEVSINRKLFVLNHYNMNVWRDSHKGTIHLFGHSHGSLPDNPNARSLDVGVDCETFNHKKFSPWSLDEVLHVCYNLKGSHKPVDHHGRRVENH